MHPLILTLALALLAGSAHAALRPGTGGTTPRPTMPQPTNPVPITGGGSPTLVCVVVPAVCVQ